MILVQRIIIIVFSVMKNEHAEVNILIKIKMEEGQNTPKKKKKPLLCLLSIIKEGMMMALSTYDYEVVV